jgi:hypothetical protein
MTCSREAATRSSVKNVPTGMIAPSLLRSVMVPVFSVDMVGNVRGGEWFVCFYFGLLKRSAVQVCDVKRYSSDVRG